MWRVHLLLLPSHTGHLAEFWSSGISFRPFISSFLLLMPLAIPPLIAGMMVANLIVWCVPPARPSFARAAARRPDMASASSCFLCSAGVGFPFSSDSAFRLLEHALYDRCTDIGPDDG